MDSVPEGLSAFCEREYPRLVGTLTLYCGDVHLAEELAQEALARACGRWNRVQTMAAPGAWVHRVAINAANSHWRRARAARRARDHLAGDAPRSHEDPDVAGNLALREAVRGLPERQRTALILRYFTDLPPAEAAVAMNTTPQAVRNLTHRAIKALRSTLAWDEPLALLEEETSHVR